MFVMPSRTRSESFSNGPSYSGEEYGSVNAYGVPILTSNTRYPGNSQSHPVSLPNSEGSELYLNHQTSAERHTAGSLSPSPLYSRSNINERADLQAATQESRLSTSLTSSSYPPRRDSTASDSYNSNDEQVLSESPVEREPGMRPRPDRPIESVAPLAPPPKRKPRREKPRIELAPDQPPTTQGKPRCRVFVACVQCRTRKIRCDGAKPACHNCSRRTTGNNDCDYDPIPKRRGPDKMPGARQRIAKEDGEVGPIRRRRRRDASYRSTTTPDQPLPPDVSHSDSETDSVALPSSIPLPSPADSDALSPIDFLPLPKVGRSPDTQYSAPTRDPVHLVDGEPVANILDVTPPLVYEDAFDLSAIIPLEQFSHPAQSAHAYITQINDNDEEAVSSVSCEPSLNFTRKIWWDSLLSLYIYPDSNRRQMLSPAQRVSAAQGVTSDIRFLFNTSNYWFSFFHIPSFYGNYYDASRRERIQPSLVLALLAMSTFWQSSEVGFGNTGRERALRFRDEAQSALDASFNAGWIDETLAQAAWLLALFEVCAHPFHSSSRSNSSMIMLDSIIRSLSLTFVDADDPKTSTFSPGAVPAVLESTRRDWFSPDVDFNPHMPPVSGISIRVSPREDSGEHGCSCRLMTLSTHWPECNDHTPLWASTPAWNNNWSAAEIRKESCRRLCWSSMILAAGHASYTTAHQSGALNLFISDPSNYALLFSGESIAYSPALTSHHSSKDTIWALHDRSFLLWHGCIRMRNDTRTTDDLKAQFAVKTWLEADALEAALNKHTCRIERQFIFQAREYIFNTRMCISYEFRRFIPLVTANVNGLFHRNKAEEWLTHQATVAERFMFGLHTITGNSNNLLARRPFFVFWFMSQISRALSLWECDHTLTVAMNVCKALLPALDYLTALWPCPEQRHRYDSLRERLVNACYVAGVNPPPPSNLTLPLSSPAVSLHAYR